MEAKHDPSYQAGQCENRQCGKLLMQSGRSRMRRYCSDSCRVLAYQHRKAAATLQQEQERAASEATQQQAALDTVLAKARQAYAPPISALVETVYREHGLAAGALAEKLILALGNQRQVGMVAEAEEPGQPHLSLAQGQALFLIAHRGLREYVYTDVEPPGSFYELDRYKWRLRLRAPTITALLKMGLLVKIGERPYYRQYAFSPHLIRVYEATPATRMLVEEHKTEWYKDVSAQERPSALAGREYQEEPDLSEVARQEQQEQERQAARALWEAEQGKQGWLSWEATKEATHARFSFSEKEYRAAFKLGIIKVVEVPRQLLSAADSSLALRHPTLYRCPTTLTAEERQAISEYVLLSKKEALTRLNISSNRFDRLKKEHGLEQADVQQGSSGYPVYYYKQSDIDALVAAPAPSLPTLTPITTTTDKPTRQEQADVQQDDWVAVTGTSFSYRVFPSEAYFRYQLKSDGAAHVPSRTYKSKAAATSAARFAAQRFTRGW